ncbi:MAG: DUF3458 domain-containing protein, partial [Acidiferrobacterales bacterium]|nr:DUF3458 domain-containing protein [Acidiferrobacterales bacterium]
QGKDIPLQLEGEKSAGSPTRVLEFTQAEQELKFVNVPCSPVPSLLRGFSAPVKIESGLSNEQLAFLLANDSDPFNRWDAGQQLSINILLQLMGDIEKGRSLKLDPLFVDAMRKTLLSTQLDPALIAVTLGLPGEGYLIELSPPANPDTVHRAREFVRSELARALYADFINVYEANRSGDAYQFNAVDAGRRSLKNSCLSYLSMLADNEAIERCMQQYRQADNMTDALAALAPLNNIDCPERGLVLQEFYDRWKGEALVINKWFSLQASTSLPNAFEQVQELMEHPDFDIRNPNRVRSLVGAFSRGNPLHFHAADGSGYRFLADQVLRLDPLNPQVASRMVGVFNNWRKFEKGRQGLMKQQLERILATPDLSKDVHEIVSKALAG